MRFLRQAHAILCFYLLLSCAGALNLSAQDFRGALRGIVQDGSGDRVPAAKILIHWNESSLQREIASDSRGEFRIDDLLPGTYVSAVEEITIILKPRPLQQTITLDEFGGQVPLPKSLRNSFDRHHAST